MEIIRWNEPRFGAEEIEETNKVLKESYVNEGPKTKELENKFKEFFNIKHVIITTSATAALFLALKADAIIRNVAAFEVIVPDMTMIASANAVVWAGGKPVLVDINRERATIDIEKIEEKITQKTTAIIPVHVLGRGVEMDKLGDLAKKHGLSIIEDAAGALGSKFGNNYLGTFGEVGCFSLQANKIITTGQGGVLITNDDRYFETIRRLRDFGRMSNKEFIHESIGYNLKFNDLSAALGVAQFNKLNKKMEQLLNQFNTYKNNLNGLKEVQLFNINDGEIPLWVDIIADGRDELVKFLKEKNIHCRECWPPIHRNPPYQDGGCDKDFPISTFISDNTLWLPNGPSVSKEQIVKICNLIKIFYDHDAK